jgi:ApbE superfamily uncharacterized protein (UPF0280 family)
MDPVAALLPGGRLHLQHGPIDLVIGADGDRDAAFDAAQRRFATVLEELVSELPLLRSEIGSGVPQGIVAKRMFHACLPHRPTFVTPMAAVAGAVADEVLGAMLRCAALRRAYVNNGGDIALHLAEEQSTRIAMASLQGTAIGAIEIDAREPVRGIATSGLGGRSLTLGIADQVTVLASNSAAADVAATLIANAVDLPGHPAINRVPAREIQPDSDLGDRPVTRHVGKLLRSEVIAALQHGFAAAEAMRQAGLIHSVALMLRGETLVSGQFANHERRLEHA